FFLFKVLLTSVFYYWAAQETLQRVVPRIHPWWITLFIVGGTYLISWKWNLHREVVAQLKWLQTIEIAIAFGLPLLLLLILWIQKATRRDVHA
ncbi:hypothetical protein, partial [Acinetobacter baumannii]|uniref:hypothetical protein n=1 Tax=Acinetobacter baumannii TaxID=470 RepID=UPI00196A18FC